MIDSLSGIRVIVTREHPGELGDLLRARGAVVIHLPLILIDEPLDRGADLARHLDRLDDFDWLVVTSSPGAERVGSAARRSPVKLAAVGAASAAALAALADRHVDLVPDDQRATALADLLTRHAGVSPLRVLVAHADRASGELVDRLAAAGHDVTSCVAYRTTLVRPASGVMPDADALLLTSGSAAQSWVEAFGPIGPSLILAIGPSTAATAERLGLKISSVSADHSLAGLVDELERCVSGTLDAPRVHPGQKIDETERRETHG
jgi:uroporphyrinogen-III synthase